MPIPPKPFKFVCKKCGYSKIVKLKSDALNSADFVNICPKCKKQKEGKKLNVFDEIISIFK